MLSRAQHSVRTVDNDRNVPQVTRIRVYVRKIFPYIVLPPNTERCVLQHPHLKHSVSLYWHLHVLSLSIQLVCNQTKHTFDDATLVRSLNSISNLLIHRTQTSPSSMKTMTEREKVFVFFLKQ